MLTDELDRQCKAQEEELEEKITKLKQMSLLLGEQERKIAKLKFDLDMTIRMKDEEFEKGASKIIKVAAQNFRLGWNQALTKEEDSCYEGPDSLDAHYGFAPIGYPIIKGMLPGDVPSTMSVLL